MGDCQQYIAALDVCIDPIPTFPCSQGKECLCDDCASPAIASNFNKPLGNERRARRWPFTESQCSGHWLSALRSCDARAADFRILGLVR